MHYWKDVWGRLKYDLIPTPQDTADIIEVVLGLGTVVVVAVVVLHVIISL